MKTADMASENFEKLKALFPNCVTESLDKDGNPVRAIDKDLLMQEINSEVVEGQKERYQFNWPGKRDAIRKANAPTTMTLRPCKDESVDFDNTQNLYIEGDNLEVLKLLQNNYLGKVKMIYIDPPYNTGNDFVYNDNFKQDSETFLETSGMFDEDGNMTLQNFEKNSESNGRFHTDWLNMMYPRLKVARNLLSDDGVIFISIDDNEQENLKKICDEIFGESNFVGQLIIQTATDNNPSKINTEHEYMACYAKAFGNLEPWSRKSENALKIIDYFNKINKKNTSEEQLQQELRKWIKQNKAELKQVDHYNCVDAKGVYTANTNSSNTKPGGYTYDILHPITNKPCPKPAFGWRWAEKTFWDYDKTGDVEWGADEKTQPHIKKRIETAREQLKTLIYEDGRASTILLEKLFDAKKIFDNPKPLHLIARLIDFVTSKESVILDFFSGSATTAHAIMQLNVEDGGNRKYICVQLPEQTDEKSEAYKAGYKNICEIGKERIRRAGKKIKDEMGLTAQNLDIGFRVLKLAESNMNDVYYKPADIDQGFLDKLDTNIKRDRTPMDLLFQVMLECDLELSSKIEEREINGKKVFFVNDKELVACFDENIDEATITEIAKLKPYYFVMRDSSLATDNVADNFEQLWNAYSKDTIRKVL